MRAAKNKSAWSIVLRILIVLFLINTFVIGFVKTSGPSMMPTVPEDSYVIARKIWFDIERDDIVLAVSPDGTPVIKRAVGLPGDIIEITEEGDIYINGEKYDNQFQSAYIEGADYVGKEVTLGEDEYFLLGDNRYESRDSRYYGPVKRSVIFGKVVYICASDEQKQKAAEEVAQEVM